MILILILLVGVVIGVAVGMGLKDEKDEDEKMSAANAARKENVQEAYQKILALFDTMPEITNDDVQKALGVSDATATNYLSALEAQGSIRQVGDAGRTVHYVKNG